MPQYKLTYFNGRGLAELSRMIMAQGDIEYEDVRIPKDDWPALKPTIPFGQLPILEIDGKHKIVQSIAIARYLAGKAGLTGSDDIENAKIDAIIMCLEDVMKPLFSIHMEKDETKKAEMKEKYKSETWPNQMSELEKMLAANNGGDGYFVGNKLSWADIRFYRDGEWNKMFGIETSMDKYPKLKALAERVAELPKIKKWVESRPQTEF